MKYKHTKKYSYIYILIRIAKTELINIVNIKIRGGVCLEIRY